MARKLTKEIVNERIVDRGLILIGEYTDTSTPTMFSCGQGHTWTTKPSHVMSGTGCPSCAGVVKLSESVINSRLADRQIRLTGPYTNNRVKTEFTCECGNKWLASAENILAGRGCPRCSLESTKHTKTEVNQSLSSRGIEMTGDYSRCDVKTEFRCSFGHTWSTMPKNVLYGKGCPYCSPKGFNRGRGGWSYIFTRDGYLKYGITGNLSERMYNHLRYGQIELVYVKYHSDGSEAIEWENNIKKIFGGRFVTKEQCPDGYTETLSIGKLQSLLETIQ